MPVLAVKMGGKNDLFSCALVGRKQEKTVYLQKLSCKLQKIGLMRGAVLQRSYSASVQI